MLREVCSAFGAFSKKDYAKVVALLAIEMKLLSGRMQADLWTFPSDAGGVRR